MQTQTPFSALLSAPHLRPSITSTYASSGATWRLDMLDFSGREHEAGMLPAWVQDAVCKGVYKMPHSNLKLSFTLSPAPGSKLPFLSIARLSAPIILEVRIPADRTPLYPLYAGGAQARAEWPGGCW